MHRTTRNIILAISIPLSILLMVAGGVALLTPGLYKAETVNWQVQSRGQDIIDLFLVLPCLIISTILVSRNLKVFLSIWSGVMLYLLYTFLIFCFDVHFNSLFVIYCLCLGLSFYGFLYCMLFRYNEMLTVSLEKNSINRVIAVYFIVVATGFYFLWLSEIMGAILQNKIPQTVVDAGLFTNGVHVIDLSLFLPGVLITGILLFKKKRIGILLTPVLLVFFILMDITIGFLVLFMEMNGLANGIGIAWVMAVLAILSLVLLLMFIKNNKT